MKAGILFDLDGTLWDSSLQVATSWQLALSDYFGNERQITIQDIQGVMGMPMDKIRDKLFSDLPMDQREEIMRHCVVVENEYLLQHGGELFPHLIQVLQELSKTYFLGIVSNCQVGYIEAFLEHHGLAQYFSDYESFGATGLQKGENIKLVVERNQLKPCLYVGDIQGDYVATCEAGLPFVHAGYGFGSIDAQVPRIMDLQELPELAAKILAQE